MNPETGSVFCCCGGLAFVGMLVGAGLGYLTKWFVFKTWPEHFPTKGSQTILLWLSCVGWSVLLVVVQFMVLMIVGATN